MAFIDEIKERARAEKKRIILPEGMDRRVWEAAVTVIKENVADVTVIATEEEVKEFSEGLDIEGIHIINPFTYPDLDRFINDLVELRRMKGMTPGEARELLTSDYIYFACMMLRENQADGIVSGACHSTANTLRPALQLVKAKPGSRLVSAFFIMVVPNCEYGANGTFIFGDAGLNANPNPEELSEIAISSSKSFEQLVGKEPKVAMLSYSTMGSAKSELTQKVIDATKLLKEKEPDLKADGELQLDAAIIPEVAKSKAPESTVAGEANVLIFPDLDAGNIGYKLVQRLAKAEAYGPLCQGIAKPVNDLSRGCSYQDIAGVIAITAVQAQK